MAAPTRSAVLALLPASAAVQPSSLVERVDTATGLLYLRGHGLEEGDELELELVDDTTIGAEATSLPGTLAEGTTYEAVPETSSAFRLRLPNSSTITSYADAGTGRFRILPDVWADLDTHTENAWVAVNDACIGNGGDVEAAVVTNMAATLAAMTYAHSKAAGDPAFQASYDGLAVTWGLIYAPKYAAWSKGQPVKGGVDATPAKAEQGARLVPLTGGLFDGAQEFERV
jgi:hypothetical protein